MKILSIETTTSKESAAVFDNGKITEINQEVKTHSAHLLQTIDKILKQAKIKLADLDYLACSVGPGSFTGIRIGLSTMQGLAMALKIPLIGVCSLDALAESALNHSTKYICSIIPERDDKIYAGIFIVKDKKIKRVGGYKYLSTAEFSQYLKKKRICHPLIFVGGFSTPCASSVSRLAKSMIEEKKKFTSFPEPIYLRKILSKK